MLRRLDNALIKGCPEHTRQWLELSPDVLLDMDLVDPKGVAALRQILRSVRSSTIGALLDDLEHNDRIDIPRNFGNFEGMLLAHLKDFIEEAHANGRHATHAAGNPKTTEGILALRAFAQERGVLARLGDPLKRLQPFVRDPAARRLLNLQLPRGSTIEAFLTEVVKYVPANDAAIQSDLAKIRGAARLYLEQCAKTETEVETKNRALDALLETPVRPSLAPLDARLHEAFEYLEGRDRKKERPVIPGEVRFVPKPPALVYHEAPDPSMPGNPPREHVFRIEQLLEDNFRIGSQLTLLRALRALRGFLRQPETPTHAQLVRFIETPRWESAMKLFDEAVEAREPRAIAWIVGKRAGGFRITPVLEQRETHRFGHHGTDLESYEFQVMPMLPRDEAVRDHVDLPSFSRFVNVSESPRRRLLALLALVDHPNVFFETRKKPIRIARSTLKLVARPTDEGRIAVEFLVDEERLAPRAVVDAVLAERALILMDETKGVLRIVPITPGILALANALARHPTDFPIESHELLARKLMHLQTLEARETPDARVQIEVPDVLLGEETEADRRTVLRFTESLGAFDLALRVRPLPGGPLFVPGEGAPHAHAVVTNEGSTASRHARRDLDDERARANAWMKELKLTSCSDANPFDAVPIPLDRALDLVVALRDRSSEDLVVEWSSAPVTVVSSIQRNELKVRVTKLMDWFGLEGEVEVDGERIRLGSLLEAVREGRRYVSVGPGRFVAIEQELRDRLTAANDHVRPTRHGLEMGLTAAPAVADLVEDPKSIEAIPSFSKILAAMHGAQTIVPEPPKHLRKVLRPYQREGFEWLARLAAWGAGACLADDMGLGKTLQALALMHTRANDGAALVVAPTSVGGNWIAETKRFAPGLRPRLYRGVDRTFLLRSIGRNDVLVTSYELATRDIDELSKVRFATLVVDEAQYVKNASTLRARAIRAIQADFRIALTGTPIENHLGELWSLFRIVSPGLFGSWEDFRDRFAVPIERDRDPARKSTLTRLVRPFLLRRTKEGVAPELPPLTEITRTVTPSRAERALYDDVRLATLAQLEARTESPQDRIIALAAITRLRRLACHPRLLDAKSAVPSSKLHAFFELVDEIRESNHRALVFSQFTDHLALVREALDGRNIDYLYLDGATPAAKRDALVAQFQNGNAPLFLISLRAGGTGLNLTAADYVIHLDPWWNPAVEDQASDRAHRIGQTRAVTVVRLVAENTIEEAVLALHAEKRALADAILDGAEAAARLSTADLVALVKAGFSAEAREDNANAEEGDDTFAERDRAQSSPPPPRVRARRRSS